MASDEGFGPPKKTLEDQVAGLADFQKDTYYLLTSLIGADGAEDTLGGMFGGLQESLDTLSQAFTDGLPSSDLLSGLGDGAAAGLGGGGKGFPSKAIKTPPKEKPTVSDMMSLPVEFSMGYLLIYNKLDEMYKGQQAEADKKKGGVGNFFKGLLEGAAGIALIAVALIAFAGALVLFQLVKWDSALVGMIAFATFVLGMTAIAKMMGNNLKDFEKFALGVLLLTAGIVLFNVAVFISSFIVPYIPPALLAIGGFTLFTYAMVRISKMIGNNMADFFKFSLGVLVMTAGIILFNVAIAISAMVYRSGILFDGLIGIGLFTAFAVGMGFLAKFVGKVLPDFLLFSLGVVALTVGMMLFGAAIAVLASILPKIPAALVGIGLMIALMAGIGALVMNPIVLALLAGVAVFSAVLAILSVSLILWGAALAVLGAVSGLVPGARLGITGSLQIIRDLTGLAMETGVMMIALVAFGATLTILGAGLIVWGMALATLGALSGDKIARAQAGIQGSLDVLRSLKGVFFEIIAMAAFGVAISVFAAGMNSFADVITKFGKIGDEEIARANAGIQKIIAFLTDPAAGGVATLFETMNGSVLRGLRKFGESLKPFSETMNELSSAIFTFGSKDDVIDRASKSIMTLLNTFSNLQGVMQGISRENVWKFKDSLADLGWGIKQLTDYASDTAVNRVPAIASALERLAAINLGGVFSPLMDLANRQADIDKLSKSMERISRSMEAPRENVFTKLGQTLANLNGGQVSAGAEGGEGRVSARITGPSQLEMYVKEIRDYMKTWESARQSAASDAAAESVVSAGGGQTSVTSFQMAPPGSPFPLAGMSFGG
jgi:hypothetical protein